jgi:hypothetical protein
MREVSFLIAENVVIVGALHIKTPRRSSRRNLRNSHQEFLPAELLPQREKALTFTKFYKIRM